MVESFAKLEELYNQVEENYAPSKIEPTSNIDVNPETLSIIRTELETLSKLDCTIDEIKSIETILKRDNRLSKAKIDNILVTKRISALRGVLNTLKNGYNNRWLPSTNDLSPEQAKFISEIIGPNEKKINAFGRRGEFKAIKSMKDFKDKLIEKGIIEEL